MSASISKHCALILDKEYLFYNKNNKSFKNEFET